MRHLANAQYWDRPAGGDTGRLFLAFGGPVCADRISICPLDRVLTYKNLIYLLNLQFRPTEIVDCDILIQYTNYCHPIHLISLFRRLASFSTGEKTEKSGDLL